MSALQRGRHARSSPLGPLLQQSFLLTISTGISAGGGFLAWSVATHAAAPHAVGVATGLFSSCSLLSYLTSLALPYGLLRYGHSADSSRMLRLAFFLTAATSIAGALVFALGTPLWAPALSPELASPAAMVSYTAFNIAVAMAVLVDAYLVARRRAGLACVRNGFVAVGKVAAVFTLAAVGALRAVTIYAAMLAPVCVSIIGVSVPLMFISRHASGSRQAGDKVARRDGRNLSAAFMRFSLKSYPGALLDGAPIFLLPVVALRLVGPTENAYFFVAWSISGVVGLLAGAVGQVTLRETASSDSHHALANRAMLLALVVTALAVLFLTITAKFILQIFGPSYVVASMGPLRLLLLSTIPGAYLTITIALLRGRKRHRAVNQVSIAYAILSIGGAVGFGAAAGVTGVCIGWLVGISAAAGAGALASIRHPAEKRIAMQDQGTVLEDSYDARAAQRQKRGPTAAASGYPVPAPSRYRRDANSLGDRHLAAAASPQPHRRVAAHILDARRGTASTVPFAALIDESG
jgi:O-antigen/teichoic acid export membrane protein